MLKNLFKKLLTNYGYTVRKRPRLLARNPEFELRFNVTFILEHLLNRIEGPTVVQVGAFDGMQNDVLYPYIRRFKIKSVLLEPQTDAYSRLVENYSTCPHVLPLRIAIADVDGTREMYRVDPATPNLPLWASQLTTFRKDVLLSHAHAIPNIERSIIVDRVPTRTFKSLFAEQGLDAVDILQIDAEGYDYEVIKLFPFEEFLPSFVRYEHLHLSKSDQAACMEKLTALGYKIFVSEGADYQDTIGYRLGDTNIGQ